MIVSILLTAWFGWWGVNGYRQRGDWTELLMGIGSLIATILLLFYFRWFMRKLKNESYL